MARPPRPNAVDSTSQLRIIGGEFRGKTILYSGDQRTRPMKDDVREAVFNLVGGFLEGKTVFDLFAGTGAVGLEAISRGADSAIMIERHFPTAALIAANAQRLAEDLPIEIAKSDTFYWCRQFFKQPENFPARPWAVFCCPPYAMFSERGEELVSLVEQFQRSAPSGSIIVVESDCQFEPQRLPLAHQWRVRQYPPAQICVWRGAVG